MAIAKHKFFYVLQLKKMWALVAEESSLTNSLNNITAKINKLKTDLCAFSNDSYQVTFVTFTRNWHIF